jgi:peptidoglycan/LPS O-acetylase OafA/YrhL
MSEKLIYNKKQHLPALDGVRGFAVLLVILFHFFGIGFGWLGVDLFFVLSGFLITGILIDSKHKQHFFRNFYIRRTLRIFPLYYFALIVFFILINAGITELKDPSFFSKNSVWYFLYIQNWLYAFQGWPRDPVMNHFWSLAIEEQFYLFWPLVVFFIPSRKLLIACISLILLSILLRYVTCYAGAVTNPVQFVITFCRLDGLAIGAIIAVLIRSHPLRLITACKWIFIITVPLIIILYLLAGTIKYDNYYFQTLGFTIFDLFWGGVLISCFLPEFKFSRNFFSMNWLTVLGKYSYGIYVYHWMIYQLCWPFYRSYAGNAVIADVRYQYGFLCLVATLIISFLSYRFMELPILRLKERFH